MYPLFFHKLLKNNNMCILFYFGLENFFLQNVHVKFPSFPDVDLCIELFLTSLEKVKGKGSYSWVLTSSQLSFVMSPSLGLKSTTVSNPVPQSKKSAPGPPSRASSPSCAYSSSFPLPPFS